MYKFITALVLICSFTYSSKGCDVCGCSAGSSQIGLVSVSQKSFIGLRHRYQIYEIEHPSLFGIGQPTMSVDRFQTYELWGQYTFKDRISVLGFVPFNMYSGAEDEHSNSFNGLGDAQVLLRYRAYKNSDTANVSMSLQLGAGIKLPTGKHTPNEAEIWLPGMMPGTGSVDYRLKLNYNVKFRNTGINVEGSYVINGVNKARYQFGNRLMVDGRFFYKMRIGKINLLPSIGVSFIQSEKDIRNISKNEINEYSGGYFVNVHAGFQIYANRFGFHGNVGTAVKQNYASGLVQNKIKCSTGIFYLFN